MSLEKIIKELRSSNPEPYIQTNGVKYKMEGDELEEYYLSSAKLILKQNEKEANKISDENRKKEILTKLNITEDEAKLLLS